MNAERRTAIINSLLRISRSVFGEDQVLYDEGAGVIRLGTGSETLAFYRMSETGASTLSLRASARPHRAAIIGSLITIAGDPFFDIVECFEIKSTGEVLSGDDAIAFAARNIWAIWTSGLDNEELMALEQIKSNNELN